MSNLSMASLLLASDCKLTRFTKPEFAPVYFCPTCKAFRSTSMCALDESIEKPMEGKDG